MTYKVKAVICSEIRTKHWTQSERIFECWAWWYVKKPLGFKRLIWPHVSTSYGHLQAGSIQYKKKGIRGEKDPEEASKALLNKEWRIDRRLRMYFVEKSDRSDKICFCVFYSTGLLR